MKELLHGTVCVTAALCVGSVLALGSFAVIEALLPVDPEILSFVDANAES